MMLPTSTEGQATLQASGKKLPEAQERLKKLREIENIKKSIAAERAARQAADQRAEKARKAREAADQRVEKARKAQEAADQRAEKARKARQAADRRTEDAEMQIKELMQKITSLRGQAQKDFSLDNTAVLLSGGPSGGISTANNVNTNNGATTSGIKEIRSPTVKAF